MTKTTVTLLLCLLTTAAHAQDDRRISIENEGWALIGNFQAPSQTGKLPAVLLLNGAARDRRAYIRLAGELRSRGVASLRLDLRGEGESTNRGRFEPGTRNPDLVGAERDVAAALAWLRSQPAIDGGRIGILGASYSGEVMAEAARAGAQAAAYVALSPGSFSDLSASTIDRSGQPWWFIASTKERFARRVVEGIPLLSRTARVTFVEGTSHGSDILSPHDNLNGEIADWFAGSLNGLPHPPLWGGLDPGAYRVGFRRLVDQGGATGLIVDLWYPATTGGEPMRLADYLRLSDDLRGASPGFPSDGSLASTLSAAMSGDSVAGDSALLERTLSSAMAAVREAPPVAWHFPLILWTPRYATTVAQSVLSEYLASHGFVVAFARREGAARMPFEMEAAADKSAELEARVRDMSAAVSRLGRLPNVDTAALGVIAWSYTGEMATMFQRSEPRVTLVAGLSTNLLDNWVYQSDQELARIASDSLHSSYALLTQPRDGPLPSALAGVAGARYYVEMPQLAHGSFNALEGFIPSLLGLSRVPRWSTSGAHGVRGYEASAKMLLRLFRHHLEGRSTEALSSLVLTSGLEPGSAIVR